MADCIERMLDPSTFEKALAEKPAEWQYWHVIRELHRQLATAKAEGAAEALDEAAQYFYDEGLPGSLALKDRATAIRKAAAKEAK